MSKPQKTCASLNCPERRSICCNAKPTEQATKNGGYFICSKCRKQYQGGECTAGDTKEKILCRCFADVVDSNCEIHQDSKYTAYDECVLCKRPYKTNTEKEWRKKLTEHGLDMYAQGQWENAQHEIHKVKQELLEKIQNLDWITSTGADSYESAKDDIINLIKGK